MTGYLRRVLRLPRRYRGIIGVILILSTSMISAQRLFNTGLYESLHRQSAMRLTGDIEIASTRPLSASANATIDRVVSSATGTARRQIFSSVIQLPNQRTQLVEMLAVDAAYPLRGTCLVHDGTTIRPLAAVLTPGTHGVVVSKAFARATTATIGTPITLGDWSATVMGIIEEEPDINLQSASYGPRVYMPYDQLNQLGFDNTMARKYYSLFMTLEDPRDAPAIQATLQTELGVDGDEKTIRGAYGPAQPIVIRTPEDVVESVMNNMDAFNAFFLFLSLFILLMSGTAFGAILWMSIMQSAPVIHDLRYLGVSWRQIWQFYWIQTLKLATVVIGIGGCVGAVMANIALNMVGNGLNMSTNWAWPSGMDVAFIGLVPLVGMMGMTMMILVMAHSNHITTHRVTLVKPWRWIALGGAGLGIFFMGFLMVNGMDMVESGMIVAVLFSLFGGMGAMDAVIRMGLRRWRIRGSVRVSLAMRYAGDTLAIRRLSFMALSVCLSIILIISHVSQSVSNAFSPNTVATRPTLFVIDILSHQLAAFKAATDKTTADTAPMIRTRIQSINGQSLEDYGNARDDINSEFLFREQNLSSRDALYESESLIRGTWFTPSDGRVEMSVEDRFAKRLQLDLGDEITFNVFGTPFSATVSSIRSVDWGTFQPNFFMLIEPPYLNDIPGTWISAVHTPSGMSTTDFNVALSNQFSNIVVIDIESTLKKVQSFLRGIFLAIQLGAWYGVLVGVGLFFLLARIYADIRHTRHQELYWIGLSHRDIRWISLIEMSVFSNALFIGAAIISVMVCEWLRSTFIVLPFSYSIGWPIAVWVGINVMTVAITFGTAQKMETN